MKIRCTTNSIRLRLRKSDIDRLMKDGQIEECLQLSPDSQFRFELSLAEGMNQPDVLHKSDVLSVFLPKDQAQSWANSNEVGIEYHKPLPEDSSLHILIEKDFPCLDRDNEDKSDTFWELADKPEQC